MPYSLIIFDMDGTLTEELLDFDAIRAEIGVASGGILEHISHLTGPEETAAREILHRHEMAAAQMSQLKEGTVEVLQTLRAQRKKLALLTRNSPACAKTVLQRHGLWETWDHISTRADEPAKPHAESILRIIRKLSSSVEQTLMVGDYMYDVQAAANAGCHSALLLPDQGPSQELPPYAGLATYRIGGLKDLLALV